PGGAMAGIDIFAQPTERVSALADPSAALIEQPTVRELSVMPDVGSPSRPLGGPSSRPRAGGAAPNAGGFIVAGGHAQAENDVGGLRMPDLPDFPAALGSLDAHDHAPGDPQAFSPTRLGLPRLTMNELDSMPAEWQELLSEPMGTVDAGAHTDRGAWSSPSRDWDGANGHGGHDYQPWGDSSEDSQAYSAAQRAWPGTDAHSAEVPDLYSSSSLEAMPGGRDPNRVGWTVGPDAKWGQSGVAEMEEEEGPPEGHDPFADPSAWARRRQRRARWNPRDKLPRGREVRFRPKTKARPLMLLLLLLMILDGGLVVGIRPDLCPQHACDAAHAKLVHYLPVLTQLQAMFVVPITATPSKGTLSVAAGGTASLALKLTNTSKQVVTWSARTGLPWLTIDATSTALAPASDATITLIVKPAATLAPGAYNTTVVFTVGLASFSVPIQINVTPHH
ncbi:MAG TPA: hypothetical protein VGR57_20470, partial [Ktedonobacterales bacterium]|nr:hypothetical protein [Ktedonobacterales bacterium]